MILEREREKDTNSITHTILLIIKNGQVLLAKPRNQEKFGGKNWNGYGGKINPGETPAEAALRELKEESTVELSVLEIERRAVLYFRFPKDGQTKQHNCAVFIAQLNNQDIIPHDTEEMTSHTWHNINDLPLNQMWKADSIWMPEVLAGKKIVAVFDYVKNSEDAPYEVADWQLTEEKSL